MAACAACATETPDVVWVPKLPRGAYPFCASPACQRAAHRRAAVVFRNHRPEVARHAPVS